MLIIYWLVPIKRKRRDGHILKNSNSFNSYVHEQMAITMAMMEANFEGVGLSNTQQERVEELRAGLDSFSLTNITAPVNEHKKTVFKRTDHHVNHNYYSHKDEWLYCHQKKRMDYSGMEMSHNGTKTSYDRGMHLLYRSQSYSNNPCHSNYGNNVYNQRRQGSELSHHDSFELRRRGSFLQQQMDRQGSYAEQSKQTHPIKV